MTWFDFAEVEDCEFLRTQREFQLLDKLTDILEERVMAVAEEYAKIVGCQFSETGTVGAWDANGDVVLYWDYPGYHQIIFPTRYLWEHDWRTQLRQVRQEMRHIEKRNMETEQERQRYEQIKTETQNESCLQH